MLCNTISYKNTIILNVKIIENTIKDINFNEVYGIMNIFSTTVNNAMDIDNEYIETVPTIINLFKRVPSNWHRLLWVFAINKVYFDIELVTLGTDNKLVPILIYQ